MGLCYNFIKNKPQRTQRTQSFLIFPLCSLCPLWLKIKGGYDVFK